MSGLPIVEPWSEEYAQWYDLIHSRHDVNVVANGVAGILLRYDFAPGNLLDVGAGTCRQTAALAGRMKIDHEAVTVLDTSEFMLAVGKEKYPGMRQWLLLPEDRSPEPGRFDLVVALFKVANYVGGLPGSMGRDKANWIFQSMAPGAFLVFDTLDGESILRSGMQVLIYEGENTFAGIYAHVRIRPIQTGRNATLEYEILIRKRGEEVAHFVTRHEITILTMEEILSEAHHFGFHVMEVQRWSDSRVYVLRKD